MALTIRYVSVAGGGAHDGTSEANAWTFAEYLTALNTGTNGAGIIAYAKTGNYGSVGASTLPSGTVAAGHYLVGYNSTIGDLDDQGRNADGTLNTSNFPDFTLTGLWTPGANMEVRNLDITGALSGYLIGSTSVDNFHIVSCRLVNTQNNAAAGCIQGDNSGSVIDTDCDCTGAAHSIVVDLDLKWLVYGCRIHTTDTDAGLFLQSGTVARTTVYGSATGVGIDGGLSSEDAPFFFENTIYGMGTAIRWVNAANLTWMQVINNHITDCSVGINSQFSGTANIAAILRNNRWRDVTTKLTGIEASAVGEVDSGTTGDETTDFVDAASGNFRLKSTAPGVEQGLPAYSDIGAFQRGGTAGGMLVHAGMQGGCNG